MARNYELKRAIWIIAAVWKMIEGICYRQGFEPWRRCHHIARAKSNFFHEEPFLIEQLIESIRLQPLWNLLPPLKMPGADVFLDRDRVLFSLKLGSLLSFVFKRLITDAKSRIGYSDSMVSLFSIVPGFHGYWCCFLFVLSIGSKERGIPSNYCWWWFYLRWSSVLIFQLHQAVWKNHCHKACSTCWLNYESFALFKSEPKNLLEIGPFDNERFCETHRTDFEGFECLLGASSIFQMFGFSITAMDFYISKCCFH